WRRHAPRLPVEFLLLFQEGIGCFPQLRHEGGRHIEGERRLKLLGLEERLRKEIERRRVWGNTLLLEGSDQTTFDRGRSIGRFFDRRCLVHELVSPELGTSYSRAADGEKDY